MAPKNSGSEKNVNPSRRVNDSENENGSSEDEEADFLSEEEDELDDTNDDSDSSSNSGFEPPENPAHLERMAALNEEHQNLLALIRDQDAVLERMQFHTNRLQQLTRIRKEELEKLKEESAVEEECGRAEKLKKEGRDEDETEDEDEQGESNANVN